MYSSAKGSRLYLREGKKLDYNANIEDWAQKEMPDDQVADDQITERQSMSLETKTHMALASQESRETFTSTQSRNGLKTVHNQRVIRKMTTVTRGEHKEPVSFQ
jgi:hypothetical protein